MMSYEQDVVDGYREMEAERWAAAHFLCVECSLWKPHDCLAQGRILADPPDSTAQRSGDAK
jgi:hypothetical protein